MTADIFDALGVDPDSRDSRLARCLVDADSDLLDELVAQRHRQGLSQEQVARKMGISQGAVARIESGDRDPHLSTLRRFALALGVEVKHAVQPYDSFKAQEANPSLARWSSGPAAEAAAKWKMSPVMV